MHRSPTGPSRQPLALTGRRTTPGRAASRLGAAALAGLLALTVAAPAHAATPAGTPRGNVDNVEAVDGGIRVRGWAWDESTSRSVTVRIDVAGTTTDVTADVRRPDVPRVFPDAGSRRGFETVVPLPAGRHEVCVTAVDVGAGSDKRFPCRAATVAGTAPAPEPARGTASATSRKLSWAPPALENPIAIDISATNRDPRLADGQDYVIRMPDTPLDIPGGLTIAGGRNVVLIGGEIRISKRSRDANAGRGLYLKGQTGTVHVEGLKITGAALTEGINMDQRRGATVQLQNVRVDTVHALGGHHADVLQTWAGPSVLRVDGLTGRTTYQGMFLLPQQYGAAPKLFDLRNVNLVAEPGSAYMMWRDKGRWPLTTRDVWVSPSAERTQRYRLLRDTAGPDSWSDVRVGAPPAGDFVPADAVGTRYVSPGYRTTTGR